MKILFKGMQAIGVVLVMVGGAGMDNASILVPLFMAIGGLVLVAAGGRMEDVFEC